MNISQTTVRQQEKHTSSIGSGHQQSSRDATRAQHHETAGCHRPRHNLEDPTKSWQKHVQQHMPRVLPTGAAKPVQLACARWRVLNGPSLLPGAAQTCTFHQTTCLPLRQPRRPIWTVMPAFGQAAFGSKNPNLARISVSKFWPCLVKYGFAIGWVFLCFVVQKGRSILWLAKIVCVACVVCCVCSRFLVGVFKIFPLPDRPSAGPPKISLSFFLSPAGNSILLSLGGVFSLASHDNQRTPNVHI